MGDHLLTAWVDITGKTFGRLTVVRYRGKSRWLCRCSCGGRAIVLTANLNKKNSTSCGCQRHESNFKHGMVNTSIYRTWIAMKSRCENENDTAYHNYGGRGIKVCERWHEFANFLSDMGMRPPRFELDRRDNNGNYCPENCRWISKRENLHNKRTNHTVEWKGETLPISEWARRLDIPERTLSNRINRGWPIDKAMTYPRHARKNSSRKHSHTI